LLSNRAPRSPTRVPAPDLLEGASAAALPEVPHAPAALLSELPHRTSENGQGVLCGAPCGARLGGGEGAVGPEISMLPGKSPLTWFNGAGAQATAKGLKAVDYFEQVVFGRKPQLPASDQSRAAYVEGAFKAVATPAELGILTAKSSELAVTKTIRALHDRVIARHAFAYSSTGQDVPPTLQKWKELSLNSLTDRTAELEHTFKGKNFKGRFVLELSADERAGLPQKEESKGPKKASAAAAAASETEKRARPASSETLQRKKRPAHPAV